MAASRAFALLRPIYAPLRPTAARLPQPDAVHRYGELSGIFGEAPATAHRVLTALLADGIVGRVSHGTAHLPSSQRYHLTAQGIGVAARILGFEAPSDFVRAYPPGVQRVARAADPRDGRDGGQRASGCSSPATRRRT